VLQWLRIPTRQDIQSLSKGVNVLNNQNTEVEMLALVANSSDLYCVERKSTQPIAT
jgi:hypothetical protein